MQSETAVSEQVDLFQEVCEALRENGQATLSADRIGDSEEGAVLMLRLAMQNVYRVNPDDVEVETSVTNDGGFVAKVTAPA